MKEIVVVSGGANGLGLELVKILHKNGFYVCNLDKNADALKRVDGLFDDNYKSFLGDVSDETFVINSINKIGKLGHIYALFNNAGSPVFKLPKDYNSKDVDLCLEGLKGMIYLSANVLKTLEKRGGKIVNIMSSAALRGNKQESVYCAIKWAERGYTESLKACYSGTGVQIYGVYPGGINTDFYKNSRDYVSVEKQKRLCRQKNWLK